MSAFGRKADMAIAQQLRLRKALNAAVVISPDSRCRTLARPIA